MNNSNQKTSISQSKGFSLIELIIVMVLIGIFSTIAMTRTNTGLLTIREQVAIDQITSDIDLAKSMSFAKRESIKLVFNIQEESYSLYKGSSLISDFPNSDNGKINLENSMLKNVDIQTVSFGESGSNELTFLPMGDLQSGGSIRLNTKIITVESVTGKWSVNEF